MSLINLCKTASSYESLPDRQRLVYRADRIEAEEILGRCREIAHDYKQFPTLWEEVALNLRVEADMQRSAKLRHRRQLVAAAAGGAVGGLIGTAASYAVPDLPAATRLIAALMGATLTGAVQNFVGKLVESPTGEFSWGRGQRDQDEADHNLRKDRAYQ